LLIVYSKIKIDKKNKNKIKLYWYKEISKSIIPKEHQLEWPYKKLAGEYREILGDIEGFYFFIMLIGI
jgi:hypothetical protein